MHPSQSATIADSHVGVSDDWIQIAAAVFVRIHGFEFRGGFEEPEFLSTADK